MDFYKGLTLLNQGFTFFVLFPAILFLGLYLTYRLRFIQFTKLGLSLKSLLGTGGDSKGITHYQAVAGVLAGNFGTGNIAGMGVAIGMGGPGALVWMWVIAFLGATIQYVSCVLGVKYRERNERGENVGGPMYYLRNGLNFKRLGALFAIFAIAGGLTAGNLVQVNSVSLPLSELGIPPLVTSLGMAFFVGLVLLGGISRFAKVAASIVPIMACFYFGTALVILGMHIGMVPAALKQIIVEAFVPSAFLGGSLGYAFMKTFSTGFLRGIFATDTGTGVAPILQSSTESKDPISNGIVTLIAPVFVMVVCTATGLVLIVTGAWQSGLQSTNMVTLGFTRGLGSVWGGHIVTIALLFFAYMSTMAWANCCERAIYYLFGDRWIKPFRLFFLAVIPLGGFIAVGPLWAISDLSFSFMLATNMIGVALLSKQVIQDSELAFGK